MKKEEHNKLLNDLKTATTDVDRMNIIIQLEKDYTGVLGEIETAKTTAETATAECNKYAKLNNELWLANSAQTSGQPPKDDTTQDEPPQKRTYEDLESKF